MTKIIIARHGNTFAPGDTVVRVGCRTDLPLVASGREQATQLGNYLTANNIIPSAVFSSTLQRAYQTASIALESAGLNIAIQQLDIFNEVDYGPDEAKTDQEIIERIGQQALLDWDNNAIVPPGWLIDPPALIQAWQDFAQEMLAKFKNQTVLVITSNGIARFAPYLTNDYTKFTQQFKPKLATGALGCLSNDGDGWQVEFWNRSTK